MRSGVAGLTVSDYTAVAPSDGAEVLPPEAEADQLTPPGGHRTADVAGAEAEVTASVGEALSK